MARLGSGGFVEDNHTKLKDEPTLSKNGLKIGRPRGSSDNNGRGEARAFALEVVRSEDYRASVKKRAKDGSLPPAVEILLWHYAYGKPVEKVQVTTGQDYDLTDLTNEELADRAALIAITLKQTRDARVTELSIEDQHQAIFDSAPTDTTPM